MKKAFLTLAPLLFILTTRAQTTDIAKNKTAKTSSADVIIDEPANSTQNTDKIFTAVEQMPQYPGGRDKFNRFLVKTVRYPAGAVEHHTQGAVIVQMVVEKDGSLSDVKVVRGVGDGCDEEAIRVVKLSAPWKPGSQNGHPERVMYAVPISFALAN